MAHIDANGSAAPGHDGSEDSDADVTHPNGALAEDSSDELDSDEFSEGDSGGTPASPHGDPAARCPTVKRKAPKSSSREEPGGKRPKVDVEDDFMRMNDMEAFVQQAERRAAAGSDAESGSGARIPIPLSFVFCFVMLRFGGAAASVTVFVHCRQEGAFYLYCA